MRLDELFAAGTTAAGVDWRKENSQMPRMHVYSIAVDTDDEPLIYSLNIVNLLNIQGLYEVSFVLHTNDDITTDHVGLNLKREIGVFSGVVACLRNFISITPDVKAIYFTSKGTSRSKLYNRLANKMANELGWQVNREVADLLNQDIVGDLDHFMIIDPLAIDDMSSAINSAFS